MQKHTRTNIFILVLLASALHVLMLICGAFADSRQSNDEIAALCDSRYPSRAGRSVPLTTQHMRGACYNGILNHKHGVSIYGEHPDFASGFGVGAIGLLALIFLGDGFERKKDEELAEAKVVVLDQG